MAMTKKDFERIAGAIAEVQYSLHDMLRESPRNAATILAALSAVESVAQSIAYALEDNYPRFDYDRFLDACGEKQA
jgi:hypothetical protein